LELPSAEPGLQRKFFDTESNTATVELSRDGVPDDMEERLPLVRVVAGQDLFSYVCLDEGMTAIVGRDPKAELALTDPSVSRQHAEISWIDNNRCQVKDLGSTNGVKLNGTQIRSAVLSRGDVLLVGNVSLRFEVLGLLEYKHLRRVNRQLRRAKNRDPLTNLYLRTYLDSDLPKLINTCERYGYAFSVAFMDLDHFKKVNDGFGHAAGDAVLQQVARLALHNSRETDVWIRYGGEEMVGLLPITDEPGSKVVGERLRRAILAHDWSQTAAGLSVTASIGLAERLPNEPVSEWLDRADRAMYAAKHGGRNRVVLASTLKS